MITVYKAIELTDVICARSFLDAHGFFTWLRNEHHITQSSGMLSLALGGYQILVIDEDTAEAINLFMAAENGKLELAPDFDENQLSLSLW